MRPWSTMVATLQTHPATALSPKRAASVSTCFMPLSTGRIIVSGPTAGVISSSAALSANAFTVRSTASNGLPISPAVTNCGVIVTSP
jgi:hypothetical protein